MIVAFVPATILAKATGSATVFVTLEVIVSVALVLPGTCGAERVY
jgi:hypothetical protein